MSKLTDEQLLEGYERNKDCVFMMKFYDQEFFIDFEDLMRLPNIINRLDNKLSSLPIKNKNQWISVKDRLPEKWGMYLVRYIRLHPTSSSSFIDHQVLHFDSQRKKWNVQFTDDEPTHWMALPSEPEITNE